MSNYQADIEAETKEEAKRKVMQKLADAKIKSIKKREWKGKKTLWTVTFGHKDDLG